MILVKYIVRKLHYLFRFIFKLILALIIIYSIVFIHNMSNENVISSIRTILLSDIDRLPAHQMFDYTLLSENLTNILLTHPQLKRDINLVLYTNICNNILPLINLTNRLRLYHDLKLKYLLKKDSFHFLINEFEKNVFPWIRRIDSSLNGYKKGTKGIVICLNNKYFQIGISSILALNSIGNKLPIEIVILNKNELTITNRNILKKLPFVTNILDVSNIFNNITKYLPIEEKIRSTFIKPFALLASSFQHVLLMDADVYFLQKPSNLFDYKEYLNTNFLLFNDRTAVVSERRIQYIKSIIPQPYSSNFNKSRVIQGISGSETESGVVLANKASQRSYLALLIICLLNTRCYRREMLQNEQFNGDKETYWFGLEIIQAPYYKIQHFGRLGNRNEKGDMLCGRALHGDQYQNPLWWNGGFRRTKIDKNAPWINFTSYIWEIEHDSRLYQEFCLKITSQQIQKLNNQQLELITIYKKYNCSNFYC